MSRHIQILLFIAAFSMPWTVRAQDTCAIRTLPYFNDFENVPVSSYANAFPNCWTRINDAIGSTNYYPCVNSGNINVIHGSKSLVWRVEPGTYYANNEYAVLPRLEGRVYDSIRGLTLSFYAKTTATEAPWPIFIVGVMASTTDTSSFVAVDTITLTSTVELYRVDFASYTDTGRYIAIRSTRTAETRLASLDDIYLNLTSHWCEPPSHLSASATDSSVTLSWHDPVSGPTFSVILGADTVTGVADTHYTFNGLADSTLYSYAVRAECSAAGSIYLRGSIQTECRTLSYADLPYSEGFESYGYGRDATISPCWRRGMTGTGVGQMPQPLSCIVEDDTVGLGFGSGAGYSSWATLPRLDDSVDVSSLEATFLIKRNYRVTDYTQLVVGLCDGMQMTDSGLQYVGLVSVDTIDFSDEPIYSLHPVSVRFGDYGGTGRYVVFVAPQLPDSAAELGVANSFILDNITLKVASPCPTPQNVRVMNTTAYNVTVTWNPVQGADTFLVLTGAHGSEVSTFTPHYVDGNSTVIGGLRPDTEYDLVVVASCGGTQGDASYPVRFHTLCAPLQVLPFTEDFERAPTIVYIGTHPYARENNLPGCWLYWNRESEAQYLGYPIVHTDATGAHSGTGAMMFSRYSCDQLALMPLTDATYYPVSNLQVSFWLHGIPNSGYQLEVGVMSDPTDTSTFVPIRTIYPTSGGWLHYAVGFAEYEGSHGHVAFRAPLPALGGNQFLLDDITLDEIANGCPPIEAIHAETTASAAHLTWDYRTEFGTPMGFNVRYCRANDTVGDTTDIYTSMPELMITGLGDDSAYWVSVAADCGSTGAADTIIFRTQELPCVDWDTVNTPGDTLVLGNPGTATNALFPIGASAPYTYVQHLFRASEIPVTGPTTLRGIGFEYAYTQPAPHAGNCTIYLAHTTRDSMSDGFFGGQQQMVYVGSLGITANGWNYVLFNQGLFEYDGVSNLCITIVKNSGMSVNANYTFRHETTVDYDMTCWGYRTHPVGTYTRNTLGSRMRSNTRLITSGNVYCGRLASCLPPLVGIDRDANGDYRLWWLPGYQESSWNVDYRIADTGAWVNVLTGTTDMSCTIPMSTLEWNTPYEFRVTAICGDTTLSTSVLDTTNCSYIDIPFTYGFEGLPTGNNQTPPNIHCWHHLNDAAYNYRGLPCVWRTAHTGDRGLSWVFGNASGYGTYQAVVLPPVNVPMSGLYLSFWAQREQYSQAPMFQVGVMTDPDDVTTFVPVDTIYIDSAGTGWELYEAELSTYSDTGRYIAIRLDRPASGSFGAYMDDIRVSYDPICRRARDIFIRNVTPDSATISWTGGDDRAAAWELTFTHSHIHTFTHLHIHTFTTDTVYNVHGLASNTPYTVAVRSVCGENDTSIACTASFHTPCYLLDSLPYTNSFENEPFYSTEVGQGTSYSNAFPSCWMRLPSGGNFHPYIYASNNLVHGNNSLYWKLDYVNGPEALYAVLPPVDLSVYDIRDLYLSFYAKTTASEAPYPTFIVGVMAHSTDTASFVPVDTVTPTGAIAFYTVSFANYTGTGNYIAIRCPRTSRDRYAMLDDIFLSDQLCTPPSNLRSSSTDSTMTVWWSPSGNNFFTVMLGADTVRGLTDTVHTFLGLTPSTVYHYAVSAECGGVNSVFLTGHNQTECPPLTYADLPYRENFESYYAGYGASDISPCWHKGEVRDGGNHTRQPNPSICRIDNDTVALYFGAGQYMSSWAALPRLDDSVNISALEVNFLMMRPNTVPCTTQLVVGFASEFYTDSANHPHFLGFTPVDTIDLSDRPAASLHDITVRFAGYTGTGRYLLFHAPSPSSGQDISNVFQLDNVTLRMASACPTPQNVRVTRVTADSVYATWDPLAGVDTFLVYVDAPRFPTVVTPVYTHSAAIGGLRPDTEYELRVVAGCNGGYSEFSFHIFFRTHCAPLATLPFVEDFEGVTGYSYPSSSINNLPPCWHYLNRGSSYGYWGFPLVHADSTFAHSGTNAMRFGTPNQYNSYLDQTAIMPLTDARLFPVAGLQVSFWARNSDLTGSDIIVGVMPDPMDTNSFIPVDTISINSWGSWYSHHTVRFDSYSGPHGHVAFRTEGPDRPYIDDIVLEEQPCAAATDLHVACRGADSLVIAWTNGGNALTSWHIEYDTVDFVPGTDTFSHSHIITLSHSHIITLTGLDSGAIYHIYVYPDCFDSVAPRHLVATTLPTTPTPLPYSGDFEESGTGGWALTEGSQHNWWTVGNATGYPGNSLYITDDGSSNHYSGPSSISFATRAFRLDTAGTYSYSFDWKSGGDIFNDFIRAALVPDSTILNPGDYSGFDNVSAVPPGGIALDGRRCLCRQSSWQNQSGTFTVDTPGNYVWVFLWHNDGSTYNQTPGAIDNIRLLPGNTPPAPMFTVTATPDNPFHGTVDGGGVYLYGDTALLNATPSRGYLFTVWDDGDRANPRYLVVVCDTSLVAHFEWDSLGIGEADGDVRSPRVYADGRKIVVTGATGEEVVLYDMLGRLLATRQEEKGPVVFDVPAAGTYLIRIGTHPARRVVIVR